MAIHDDQNDGNRTSAASAQGGFNAFDSFHTGGLFAAPISQGMGSEFYTKVKQGLLDLYKDVNPNVKIALIDLDNVNNPAFDFSNIIVAAQLKNAPELGVAYHILALEATGEKLGPVMDTINNQTIEIQRVTSDTIDTALVKAAAAKVEAAFPGVASHWVDATVVPDTFNPDDKTAMHKLALFTGLACSTELQIHSPDFRDLNLAHIKNEGQLTVRLDFGRQQVENIVGQPQRSDVSGSLTSRKNVPGRQAQVNTGDKEAHVARVGGFIDLVWAPRGGDTGFNPWLAQQQQQQMAMNPMLTQKYAARLVLTDIQSRFAYTPSLVLLAVATSLTASDNNNWFQAYRPTPSAGKGSIDLNDIGALNIEANISNEPGGFGSRINTKGEEFQLSQLGTLIGMMVQPGMMLAIDVPEAGPQSWYLSMFANAANGSQAAYDAIYNAANELTNGAFSRHFAAGTQMFVDTNNRVHLGNWTDRLGNKRDIRDIDYLAVANLLGDSNPSAIRDWSDTFLRTEYPLPQRLAARKRMISSLTGETAVFTGFAQRVTFSGKFLAAFGAALREVSPPMRVTTPLSASELSNQRGYAGFAEQAMLAPGQTFAQVGGFGNANAYAGYFGPAQRWM